MQRELLKGATAFDEHTLQSALAFWLHLMPGLETEGTRVSETLEKC